MCVIFANESELPPLDLLEAGEKRNDDGGGVAWIEKKKVKWKKNIKAKEIYEILKGVGFPSVAHFRIATAGGIKKELTHPFPISPKTPLFLSGEIEGGVLFHNGHVNKWEETLRDASYKSRIKLPGGDWSDSRALAWLVAHFGEGILATVMSGGKVAILTPQGLATYGSGWIQPVGKGYMHSSPVWGTYDSRSYGPSAWQGRGYEAYDLAMEEEDGYETLFYGRGEKFQKLLGTGETIPGVGTTGKKDMPTIPAGTAIRLAPEGMPPAAVAAKARAEEGKGAFAKVRDEIEAAGIARQQKEAATRAGLVDCSKSGCEVKGHSHTIGEPKVAEAEIIVTKPRLAPDPAKGPVLTKPAMESLMRELVSDQEKKAFMRQGAIVLGGGKTAH